MRVFKNKWFVRFASREGIPDRSLCLAVRKAETGLIDADLGGGVIKQRIARPGQGESGGYRSIILFRCGDKAFFVFGFPKSAMDNIGGQDVKAFKKLAREMLALDGQELALLLDRGALTEVACHGEGEDLPE
ncbi:type II toxin-antitoxin system RelE/ParE family toxin [Azospirillum sp. RWY-5-1]|uniref:Type II toxin-antitoxin system RelE/ParE family toxin n=1 Tax=Azospirillum oleiclasticum TaxID=2735135 RepID=A0ABX2T874_9PROT|nr:type II toxin-antitoxin system RelE/ParE family toxin [Azospirillum oleiclasticum]NYZ20505.1 type II toxin-antitoxin system RelE/ParE family toxin [Azospirillum oleiclasticum]